MQIDLIGLQQFRQKVVCHIHGHEIVNHLHFLLGYKDTACKTISDIPKFLTPHPGLFSLYHKATKSSKIFAEGNSV